MANATLEEKEAKAAGKFRGFRVEILCASLEELDKLLPHLGKSLEVGTVRGEWVFMKMVYPSSVILHLQQKPMCLLIQGFFVEIISAPMFPIHHIVGGGRLRLERH